MLPVEEAVKLLLEAIQPVDAEVISLDEAFGRVLAEDIVSGEDVPGYDRSAMDGYAIRSVDTKGATSQAPAKLQVVESIAAGHLAGHSVVPGTTVGISTGGALPAGADAVVRFEETREGEGFIEVFRPIPAGENVGHKGEDIKAGTRVLARGAVVGAAEIGVLAALGIANVRVYRKPKVAIISTGDEVVPVESIPGPGQVRNSTAHTLAAAIRGSGGMAKIAGLIKDDLDSIVSALGSLLEGSFDVMITTGGASVGKHDHIRAVMEKVGAKTLFWRVAIKPGMNIVAATLDGRLIIGLSGNPAAALTTFEILVRPVFSALCGRPPVGLSRVTALLDSEVKPTGGRTRYVRAKVYMDGSVFRAEPVGSQLPSVLLSMTWANALLAIPPGGGSLKPGDEVQAFIINGREAEVLERSMETAGGGSR